MNSERWRRIDETYHAAQACEPAKRRAFIDEACGGDGELKRQIEFLPAQNSSREQLNGPACEAAPDGLSMDNLALSTLRPIRSSMWALRIPRYRNRQAGISRRIATVFRLWWHQVGRTPYNGYAELAVGV
jgi:hypothetical protein